MVGSKKNEVVQALFSVYKDMYDAKSLFNKSYFKYTPNQIFKELKDELTDTFVDSSKDIEVSKSVVIRDEILSLKNEMDVLNFMKNNFIYDNNAIDARETLLKSFSTEELKHMYNMLYSSPLRSKVRKSDVLTAIEKYFDSMDRIRSMKP
ncbi:hypothetical protein [Paenibacillus terrae]|uniref:Uncharacterized protein n=1 Tax=Paenibacillus terrae TaxID=159743 RepID=A0A0D7X5Z6_9BACL|nr:hypothetical protein [Paenibacillus terrae]KJD46805.1 hypothetical protein QD47_04675 [Paenibacillus terrae]